MSKSAEIHRPNMPFVDMIHMLNDVTPGNVSRLAFDMSYTQRVQSEKDGGVQWHDMKLE